MIVQLNGLKLSSIAAAVPSRNLDFSEFSSSLSETDTARIVKSTGIKTVPVAKKGTQASDLCVKAAQHLFENKKIAPETVDGLVFVSQTPDRMAPATSAMMQHRLKLPKSSVAFDINYGCSGYIYGLYQAALLVSSGSCKRVLLCSGDVISPYLHPKNHNLRMLLGDAGCATLVEEGEDSWVFNINTDGSGAEYLTAQKINPSNAHQLNDSSSLHGYYFMDGNAVMTFALKVVPEVFEILLQQKGWAKEDLQTLALHQPNQFMVNFLQKKLKLEKERVPLAVENVGNTGPASIPLLLSMLGEERKIKEQMEKAILCGFGVGLSWGGVALDLSQTDFYQPILMNE